MPELPEVETTVAGLRPVLEGKRLTLVEPRRACLIAGFAQAKAAALQAGAMGASISGAGPSVFAWFETAAAASLAAAPVQAAFAVAGLPSQAWISPINAPAAHLCPSPEDLP